MAEEKIIIIYIVFESSCFTGQYKYPNIPGRKSAPV